VKGGPREDTRDGAKENRGVYGGGDTTADMSSFRATPHASTPA
jgi:hypothetical protein